MTTATIIDSQTVDAPVMWDTGAKSQKEKFFNNYWAAVYEFIKEENIAKLTQSSLFPAGQFKINPKNLEAIRILDQWFAEPDNLGEEFWNEFCEDLEKNRFKISR